MSTEQELIDYAERIKLEAEYLDLEASLAEYIEHHGVKGQKWGVRQKRGNRSAVSNPLAATKHLTTDQLRQAVERMRLEQQFSEMSKPRAKGGKKFALHILESSGKAVVGGFVTAATASVVGKVFKQTIKKATG